ncbi:unnamed protein product [Brachionus calyciflorus]|uniref:HTH psq-type domain-containing protein n=1 Tax=Brachionus calyciflorus TaxID=104777 RepID=A0A814HYV0_9BILA|nr:unnamed protein product [Brachionus calyciflorus]
MSTLDPPLLRGDTLAIFQSSGKATSEYDLMKINDKDNTDAKIAEEFNVKRFTIIKIFQRKDKYLNLVDEEAPRNKSRIQLRYFSFVEETLYKWYLAAKSANIP